MDCSPPSSSMEFSRQEYWSGLPFPSPGIFPTQRWNPGLPLANKKALLGPGFSKTPNSCHRAAEDTVALPLSNSASSLSPVKTWDRLGEDPTIQSHLREIWRSRPVFFIHLLWHKYPAHPCRATSSSSVTGTCDNPCLLEWNQHALSSLLSVCFIPGGCIIWLLISQGSGNKEVLGGRLGRGRE